MSFGRYSYHSHECVGCEAELHCEGDCDFDAAADILCRDCEEQEDWNDGKEEEDGAENDPALEG